MTELSAFVFPPLVGNAIALVAYYAVFIVAQIVLGIFYLRGWNRSIFLRLITCLIFQTLGSIAYLKLHYNPVTGGWYNL